MAGYWKKSFTIQSVCSFILSLIVLALAGQTTHAASTLSLSATPTTVTTGTKYTATATISTTTGGSALGGVTDTRQHIAAEEGNVCVILQGGEVACHGYNDYGQLGNGTFLARPGVVSTPVRVSGLTDAVSISMRNDVVCVVTAGGQVKCWGQNAFGQIGDTLTAAAHKVPFTVPGISTATDVAVGDSWVCAVLSDGSAKCWGANNFGYLGNGTTTGSPNVPVSVKGPGNSGILSGVTDISAGFDASCAVVTETSEQRVYCWGDNTYGGLGNGTSGSANKSTFPVRAGTISDAVEVGSGEGFNCARHSSGQVSCWGSNLDRIMIDSLSLQNQTVKTPFVIQGGSGNLTGVDDLTVGAYHICAEIGTALKCWGSNSSLQLGMASPDYSTTPVDGTGVTDFSEAVAGSNVTCATLTSTGQMSCWGNNAGGIVSGSLSTTAETEIPTNVPLPITGSIVFKAAKDGGSETTLGTVAVGSSNQAKLQVTPSSAGSYSVKAYFSGHPKIADAESAAVVVTVNAPADATPPVLTVPANIVVGTDPRKDTAKVTYTVTATDAVDGAVTPTRVAGLASGADFPVGKTTVSYKATDAANNTSAVKSFTVTVIDHSGGPDNDTLNGTDGPDDISGGKGNDTLNGKGGADNLDGDEGGDVLNGGADGDTMRGGPGNDVYIVESTGDKVIELLNQGEDTVVSSISYKLPANVENLSISAGGTISGTGNDHDNEIVGYSGVNVLKGMDGDDVIEGRGGKDNIDGGPDNDSVSYSKSSVGVEVNLKTGAGKLGDAEGDTIKNIENIIGSSHDDVLDGNSGNNILRGGPGADELNGRGGKDVFVYLSVKDSPPAGEDFIPVFRADDVIDLSAIDANEKTPKVNDAFIFVSAGKFSGKPGEVIFDTKTASVKADTNGDSKPDLVISLKLFDPIKSAMIKK